MTHFHLIRSAAFFSAILLIGVTQVTGSEFQLTLRSQVEVDNSGDFRPNVRPQSWEPARSAVIVCDMWDAHHCYRAVQRATEMAPRLNEFVEHARKAGATIIHAPSGCMSAYADHAARDRAIDEPKSDDAPTDINQWCYSIDSENPNSYPIDQSDGGEDDTETEHSRWAAELVAKGLDPKAPWKKQIDAIRIASEVDFISDQGDEIWSILANRSIDNVMLVGVHTNMCVLGRPFGLRQLTKNGKNVVLVRDLTDTMYNPASKPFVSHFTGTDLIVSYIQRYVCPTITSDQLLGGMPFRFSTDQRPTVAFMIGEGEYSTEETLPSFAIDQLGKFYRVVEVKEDAKNENHLVGLDQLDTADALLVSVRRKTLPLDQLQKVRDFVQSGKPIIGIRTASHAFCLRGAEAPPNLADWPEFDAEVFGGNYTNHHGNAIKSTVRLDSTTSDHPILSGLQSINFQQGGSLYKTSPLAEGTTLLMIGSANGLPPEPVAWTFERADGGVSFYTSLGHRDDFANPAFTMLLKQAIDWCISNQK